MRFRRGPTRPAHPGGIGADRRARPAVDWLIVGLGNPGREHERTRHNVGFDVLDVLAERWQLGKPSSRFKGRLAEGVAMIEELSGTESQRANAAERAPAGKLRVALLWPQTYMNDAGRSVGPARGSYRLPLERVLVLHDEIDLPFGELRARQGGGLAGHNGLKSLSRELGGPGFWRVRVGVGRPDSTDPEVVASYVLSRFREPAEQVRALVEKAATTAEEVLREGLQR